MGDLGQVFANELLATPANYDKKDDDAGRNRDLDFFTNVKKRKLCHSRVERGIGTGTWHGQDAGKQIIIGGKMLGLMRRFTYRNSNSKHDGQWLMLEYSILDETCVLCRLRKKGSADEEKDSRIVIKKEATNPCAAEDSPASSSSISEDPRDPAAEALPSARELLEGLDPTVAENRPVLHDSSTEQQLPEFLKRRWGESQNQAY